MLRCFFLICGFELFAKFSKISQIFNYFLNTKNFEFCCCHQMAKIHQKKKKNNINSGHAT
jgi:hypothetical protein